MPAQRKTSLIQLSVMITYLEKHRDSMRLSVTPPFGRDALKREEEHWQKLGRILNKCPGEKKSVSKWRQYFNDLKWVCRKKASDGKELLPHEVKVLKLVGTLKKRDSGLPVVVPFKTEPMDNTEEKSGTESDFGDDSRSPFDNVEESTAETMEHSYTTVEPMSTVDVTIETHNGDDLHRIEQIEEEEEREKHLDRSTSKQESGEVPEWVRTVEQSRLSLETRTTKAIEKMSDGITAMAEAMRSVVGSLRNIEAALSSNDKKCNCRNS